MSSLRIQPQTALATLPSERTPTRTFQHWAMRLTSPIGVVIAFPSLTLLVGGVLTAQSHARLSVAGRERALMHFSERARQAEENLRRALDQADTLLNRTAELSKAHTSQEDPTRFAYSLRDLSLSRKGLKWLSVSFPDGTFQGVFLAPEGVLRFQHSWIHDNQTTMQQFDWVDGRLVAKSTADFWYDPREREFYRQAIAEKHRVWTAPYTFYPDFHTGITRAQPLFDDTSRLHAVITADYDLAELSGLLAANGMPEAPMLVFTPAGAVLAMSGIDPSSLPKELSKDRPLHVLDLNHQPWKDFFESQQGAPPAAIRTFQSSGRSFVALERPLEVGADLGWSLATLLDEQELVASAREHAKTGLLASAMVSLVGAAVAAVIGAGINRLRAQRTRAEQRADVAIEHARELGSYQLTGLLGSGGMGEVYRARHRMLAKEAAIKLIRTDLPGIDAPLHEARFEREAMVLARLRSPNTVSVFDYGRTTDGRLFLVMELLEGFPLDQLVAKHGPQPIARAIPMLVGVCRSLSEAHAAGLVHRDIKPANIFLCYDGDGVERVKVLDFGLAKVPRGTGLTMEGAIAGTPDYMAPEQARGAELDCRTDLYSVGCTAFFLLSGRPVFIEPSAIGTVLAHQVNPPPLLSACAKQWIPVELDQLVQRCLSKDPALRPSSAAALARALLEIPIPNEHAISADFLRTWWDEVAPPRPPAQASGSSLPEPGGSSVPTPRDVAPLDTSALASRTSSVPLTPAPQATRGVERDRVA